MGPRKGITLDSTVMTRARARQSQLSLLQRSSRDRADGGCITGSGRRAKRDSEITQDGN